MCNITNMEHIELTRLLFLRSGLRLEIQGIKKDYKTDLSSYVKIKREFFLKGNRREVLIQFNEKIMQEFGKYVKEDLCQEE